jgi:hypothetical protein
LPDTAPTTRAPRGQMLCPACNGDSFTERSSFKTASEPLLGAESAAVMIDLMTCRRCGADIPAVRGRRRYALVGSEKLASIVADLEQAKRTNSEMEALVDTMAKRSQSLDREIMREKARGEVSVMEARVASLEAQNGDLERRKARLVRTIQLMAARPPAVKSPVD